MSNFAVLLLCVQACLVQNVYSRCIGAYGQAATIAPALPFAAAAPFGYAGLPGACSTAAYAPYGGVGEGNVAVVGELPVAGTTAVAGQVPIMGAVSFGGAVPAAGAVSIAGSCSCGCGSPYNYGYNYII